MTLGRRGRKRRGDTPRFSTLEKLVILGAALAFVVLSYFLQPIFARRAAEHQGAARSSAPVK